MVLCFRSICRGRGERRPFSPNALCCRYECLEARVLLSAGHPARPPRHAVTHAASAVASIRAAASAAAPAPGSLDTTFGTGGVVTTGFGPGSNVIRAVAVQSDKKVVGAG